MRNILRRLAVWILLAVEAPAFSAHLRQSNNSIHTQAKEQPAADGLSSSQSALDVTSILRIRAYEYLELLRSTFGSSEARIVDISSSSGTQYDLLRRKQSTPHAMSSYASSSHARMSNSSRFLVAILLVGCCLAICLISLPTDEEAIAPRPLTELYETNSCNGTWARSYQNADTKDKQALEMLFRCHIIAAQEFRHSTINQPHVDECIWIGRRMLVDRSLEEWLDRCSEAQQKFEESLNACSEEKWKVRSGLGSESDRAMDFPLGPHTSNVTRDRDMALQSGALTPQHDFFGRDTSQTALSPHAAILKSPNARHRLLLRCTEIMAEYDRERRSARRSTAMSDFDVASPKITPPPTAGDISNPWPMPAHSSAPPGMYPQSARNDVSGTASSSDRPPWHMRQPP